jgi:hypothetical protein
MEFDLKDIAGSQDRVADAALIGEMVSWFLSRYESPAESTPWDSGEGGYQYLWGGPYDARDAIAGEFVHELMGRFNADELGEIIDAAVEEIESEGA